MRIPCRDCVMFATVEAATQNPLEVLNSANPWIPEGLVGKVVDGSWGPLAVDLRKVLGGRVR